MLATNEKVNDLKFFWYTDKELIVEEVKSAYEHYSLEAEVVSASDIIGGMMDLFVQEQIERQAIHGDMPFCHSQEECMAALKNNGQDEAWDEIYTTQMEILGSWGTFGNENYGIKAEIEKDFASDILRILDDLQLFYMSHTKEWTRDAFVSTVYQGLETTNHSSLQEVW